MSKRITASESIGKRTGDILRNAGMRTVEGLLTESGEASATEVSNTKKIKHRRTQNLAAKVAL